ncbi:MAG: hypothetical protein IMZ65_02705 [Planctomycetes bacterium]|nr:hypothetical protein [Planctomycetota bacterium]
MTNRGRSVLGASAVIVLVAVWGCDRGQGPPADPALVDATGVYVSPSGRYRVVVFDDDGVVYRVEKTVLGGEDVFSHVDGAGRHMRWFLYWGPDDSLWHYTADNGKFMVWKPDDEGTWRRHFVIRCGAEEWLYNDPIVSEIPPRMLNYLPADLCKRWGLHVQKDDQGRDRVERTGRAEKAEP